MKYPKTLQIEPTNSCNFNCVMCIRNNWDTDIGYMDMGLYKKIAEEAFPYVERITLYGEGEPLVHPKFLEMVKIAKDKLPPNGTVFFVTNGSLLTKKVADELFLEIGLDEIAFSVDTTDFIKLSKIRRGIIPSNIFLNLKYVAQLKNRADFKLGMSVVLMKSNYRDLPELVKAAYDFGVDYISASFVVPYYEDVLQEVIYSTISRESFELSEKLLVHGDKLVLKAVYEAFFQVYGDDVEMGALKLLRKTWSRANEKDVDINTIALAELKKDLPLLLDVQKTIDRSKELAEELGIALDAPNVFQKLETRGCPYAKRDAVYIRWDGKVAPCMNYSYTHDTFINGHKKVDKEVIFGDLRKESLGEILEKIEFKDFRRKLDDMNRYYPWCGNCSFSSTGCWFVQDNKNDCYGNEPTCSECLYSMDLAKCLI